MNTLKIPIYTKFTECKDCYKCVRECSVKAIKIEDFHASIVPDLCIHCGHCVDICPADAKQVRDDLSRVKTWLKLNKRIVVSLAPSWSVEFPEFNDSEMISFLEAIGFYKVSETALGAEIVSAKINDLKVENKLYISSACPTVVQLINMKFPEFSSSIIQLESPMIAHARSLKEHIPEDALIVFVGPCFAKKKEVDENPNLIDAAITFKDLTKLISEIDSVSNIDKHFYPSTAEEGKIYPVDGGMLSGIKDNQQILSSDILSVSGIKNIFELLENLNKDNFQSPFFLELMACEGGCVNGPGSVRKVSYLQKRIELINSNKIKIKKTKKKSDLSINKEYHYKRKNITTPTEKEIQAIFHSIGKYNKQDQLNCGGCGYNTCRKFAEAIVNGMAEHGMCVSYLRKRAQKKANALFRRMPSGAIIVNKDLRVVESNQNFFKMLKLHGYIFEEDQGFEGAQLERLITFDNLFTHVLNTGEEIIDKEFHYNDIILKLSIFTIEPHHLVGAIVQDITKPSIAREQTITKAREVIQKNLEMVQKVAYLLGENAAEVEITLNSIIDVSSPDSISENKKGV